MVFFSKHRIAIMTVLLLSALLSVAAGHRLAQARSANAEAPAESR